MDLLKRPRFGKKVNLLVIGAGEAGELIVDTLNSKQLNYNILALVDDDSNKIGKFYKSIPIVGPIENINSFVQEKNAEEILIAIPSAEGKLIKNIVNNCQKSKIDIKILPSYFESRVALERNVADIENVRKVEIDDFFRRKPVITGLDKLKEVFSGKVILVTGGAGSIGSELCRQLLELGPSKLIALDNAETPLHSLMISIDKAHKNKFIPVIGDIKDKAKLAQLFKTYSPEIVFHAAAYKHIPMMEFNPDEAIKNNVFGTMNLVEAAETYNVANFVLISTDKAVNPASIMGVSKRLTEMMIQNKENSKTNFIAVRFGNVLNSQGSVVPLFKKQIEKGGPLTITHKDMERFFMTIPEAVHLVMQAIVLGKSGNIFVLDMGEPVKILSLAEEMVKLEGFNPYEDIDIEVTGIRPGEKLREELSTSAEEVKETENKRIFLVNTTKIDEQKLSLDLNKLRASCGEACEIIINDLKSIIPNFNHNSLK